MHTFDVRVAVRFDVVAQHRVVHGVLLHRPDLAEVLGKVERVTAYARCAVEHRALLGVRVEVRAQVVVQELLDAARLVRLGDAVPSLVSACSRRLSTFGALGKRRWCTTLALRVVVSR